MKMKIGHNPLKDSGFWDLLVVRDDGQWVGFRAPWRSLRKVASFFALVLIVAGISLTGWFLSRWQVERLSRSLAAERLKGTALEAQVNELRLHSGAQNSAVASSQAVSFLPVLEGDELLSNLVSLQDLQSSFDPDSSEFALQFDLVRAPPREGSSRFFWILLLHGPQGVLAFPAAIASRRGDMILFHKGQVVDDVKTRRSVNARFKVQNFVKDAGAEPVYSTLLVYDEKGTLLLKHRSELSLERAAGVSKGRGE